MSVHFKQREISFPWSIPSILSVWLVQSREQLINLVSVCDGAVCSLVSASHRAQRKVEQILRTVSFQGHCFPYLFFTVLKEHWWVPFNSSFQSFSVSIHKLQLTTLIPRLRVQSLFSFPFKEHIGLLHS